MAKGKPNTNLGLSQPFTNEIDDTCYKKAYRQNDKDVHIFFSLSISGRFSEDDQKNLHHSIKEWKEDNIKFRQHR